MMSGRLAVAAAVAASTLPGCTIQLSLPPRHRTCEDPECWDSKGRGCPTDCGWDKLICGDGICDEGCANCPQDCDQCGEGIHEEAGPDAIGVATTMKLELRPDWNGGWSHSAECASGLADAEGQFSESTLLTFRDPDTPVAVDLVNYFPFAETSYSTAWVSRNGFVAFGDAASAVPTGYTLEEFGGAPRVSVAFRPLSGASVEVLQGGSTTVFIWSGFSDPRSGAPAGTLAIALRSDGSILLAWASMGLDSAILGVATESGAGEKATLLPACQ